MNSCTPISILALSYCPLPSHKILNLNSLINCSIFIPYLRKAFQDEVAVIKLLAHVSGLKLDIDYMVHKKLTSRTLDFTTLVPKNIPVPKRREKLVSPISLDLLDFALPFIT